MTQVPHVPATASFDVMTRTLQEHGAVIVDDFLEAETLARFNTELDPLLENIDPARSFVNPIVSAFFGTRPASWKINKPVNPKRDVIATRNQQTQDFETKQEGSDFR